MRLSRSDLEGALDFLRAAGEQDGASPFPSELLCKLASLVSCEYVTYCEIDRLRHETTFRVATDPEEGFPADEAYWATLHEHPVRNHRSRTGDLGAFKIHDFLTPRELRRTQFYSDFLSPINPGGFLMSVCLPAPPGTTRTFNFERGFNDFGERERALLELLQPHLLQFRRAAEVRRRARLTLAAAPEGALTERETDVLARVAEGMRNREIAEALWIAPGTVRKHLDNIYAKLGARTRTAAVRLAQERGMLASAQNRSRE